ncbi:MAG: NAD-dependent epimerase/dehydratase family protein, partial [Pseudomonadota bacterium]
MPHHTVLVTGATGYIARHIVHQLLEAGHAVVGSVRDMDYEDELRAALGGALQDPAALERLTVVYLDLNADTGWPEAMEGVDVVMHVASPVPDGYKPITDDYITTAIDGTHRACRFAYAAGIRRIIVTSSIAAIMGAPDREEGTLFTEAHWCDDTRPELNAYSRSKVLSERAFWAWKDAEGPEAQATSINPAFVVGPSIGTAKIPSSLNIVGRLMTGHDKGLADLTLPYVDVRDVARMHVLAMDMPQTVGRRYISSDAALSFQEVAEVLRALYPEHPIPSRVLPRFLVRLAGLVKPEAKALATAWGNSYPMSQERAKAEMGMSFMPAVASLQESAHFLVSNDM